MATVPIHSRAVVPDTREQESRAWSPAIRDLRRVVLEELQGLEYRPIAGIPSGWPILRSFVFRTVRQLADEGLLESTLVPGRGGGFVGYRSTAAGRRELKRLRAAPR